MQRASGNSTSTGTCSLSVASGTQKEGVLIYGSAFVPTIPLLDLSHQILDIGVMSRGDSFLSSSIAPASSTPPSISFHMSRNPENHVILRSNGLTRLGKKCHIDGADHAITLITVKSSIEILDSPSQRSKRSESPYPVRLPTGSTPPHRTISLLETKLDDHPVLLKFLKAAIFCDVSNAAIYS